MLSKNTILTIGSRFTILLVNFALVIFSSHAWGSEGRGVIALVMANISVIVIFSNVFCGSSLTYNTPGEERNFLISINSGRMREMKLKKNYSGNLFKYYSIS